MTHHSRPDSWIAPRPYSDPTLRRMKHGPLLPMVQEPSKLRGLIVAAVQGVAIIAGFFLAILGFALVTP